MQLIISAWQRIFVQQVTRVPYPVFTMCLNLQSEPACGTSEMPVLSESCNVESNSESACHIPYVTHVLTVKLVDMLKFLRRN